MVANAFTGALGSDRWRGLGWPLRTRLIAAAGLPPGRAVVEEGVVEGLDVEQAAGGLLADRDPGQVTEVLESLDAGCDHDQQVGVRCRGSCERMRQPGRHDGQVSFPGNVDAVTGEQLNGTAEHVEQLSRVRMVVGTGAVGAATQGDPLRAQPPAGGRAVGQQPHRLRGKPDDLRVCCADQHRSAVIEIDACHTAASWCAAVRAAGAPRDGLPGDVPSAMPAPVMKTSSSTPAGTARMARFCSSSR